MKNKLFLTGTLLLLWATQPANADSLYGSQVTLTVDYPTFGNVVSDSVTKTIGPGVEFPSGTLIDTLSGTHFVGANIDIGTSSIDLASIQGGQTLSAAFNGYVFTFSGAKLLSATLDPASTFTSAKVPVTFGSNYVAVNEQGLSLTASSNILVDLTFTTTKSAAPEPNGLALLLIGASLLMGTQRALLRFTRRRSLLR